MQHAAGLAHDDAPRVRLDKLDALLAQTSTTVEDAMAPLRARSSFVACNGGPLRQTVQYINGGKCLNNFAELYQAQGKYDRPSYS
jgi:hypothetical protein